MFYKLLFLLLISVLFADSTKIDANQVFLEMQKDDQSNLQKDSTFLEEFLDTPHLDASFEISYAVENPLKRDQVKHNTLLADTRSATIFISPKHLKKIRNGIDSISTLTSASDNCPEEKDFQEVLYLNTKKSGHKIILYCGIYNKGYLNDSNPLIHRIIFFDKSTTKFLKSFHRKWYPTDLSESN